MKYVYAQFPGNWAECYEFSNEAFMRISRGDLTPLDEAGVTGFFRVTVEDSRGFREVWRSRR